MDKLTPVMKKALEMLEEKSMTDLELIDNVPGFSLELLGKLRDLDAIDHHGRLVYITSTGKKILQSN